MSRTPILLFCAVGATLVAAACGSSSGSTTTNGTTSTGGKTSTSSHTSAASTTSTTAATTGGTGGTASTTTAGTGGTASTTTGGTGGMAGTGGGASACQQMCVQNNMAGFQTFEGDQLQSCGCGTGASAKCSTECTAECANPSSLTQNSPCGMCLLTQAGMGAQSACTLAAAGKCFGNPMCSAFISCAMACP